MMTWRPLIRQPFNFSKKLIFIEMYRSLYLVAKIDTMNKVDDTQYNPKWDFSKSVPFKTLITQHKDWFSLNLMAKNDMVYSQQGNI